MTRLLATLCLTTALALPIAARADEAADKVAEAKTLVSKTLIKNLKTGFDAALEKTVAAMPDDKSDSVRKELMAEFDKQSGIMVEGLSKEYATKFTLTELKHLNEIYEDKTYLKFQAINADPSSSVTAISQASVTKLLNMLAIAAAGDNTPKAGAPMPAPTPAPAPAPAPADG
ncbi:hypothetical protein, partial [Methylobacterium sp. WL116]|uniref:hypothetical protein n=1 Tax=Methylobacterium sp. WL116 TaxID=2603889 RepID=UPI001FF01E64